jgi:hypothetical protein
MLRSHSKNIADGDAQVSYTGTHALVRHYVTLHALRSADTFHPVSISYRHITLVTTEQEGGTTPESAQILSRREIFCTHTLHTALTELSQTRNEEIRDRTSCAN